MTNLSPEYQLMLARQQMMGQQSGLASIGAPRQSSYINSVEQNAAQAVAGGLNIGQGAIMGAPMALGMAGMFSSNKMVRGVDKVASAFDPFSMVMDHGMKMLGGGITAGGLAAAAIGVGGAYVAGKTMDVATGFAKDHMLQGQADFLATRSMARQLPTMGFGQQSVLSPMSHGVSSNHQVSELNSQLKSITSEYGMSMGQGRNLLSGFAQSGMVNTSSTQAISSSFRAALTELKQIAGQIGADIQEAYQAYQVLDKLGLKSQSSRNKFISNLTSTSSMTGMSMGAVGSVAQMGADMAQGLGLEGALGGGMALSALRTGAMMSSQGTLDRRYTAQAGGDYASVAQRMLQIQLQSSQSSGAVGMLGASFNADGTVNMGGLRDMLHGKTAGMSARKIREFDPYQLSSMQEDMIPLTGAMTLSRVHAIQQQFSGDPLRANREQYKFMSSMGIGDPREQKQYLRFLQTQPAADFAGSLQESKSSAFRGKDPRLTEFISASDAVRDIISSHVRSLAGTFERAGEVMQRTLEDSNKRVATAIGGHTRSYGTVSDMGSMSAVRRGILRGDFEDTTSVRGLQTFIDNDAFTQRSLSAARNVRGVDDITRAALLQSPLDKAQFGITMASNDIGYRLAEGRRSALAAFGLEVKAPSARDLRGGLAEMLTGEGNRGNIYLGMDAQKRGRTGNAGDYLSLLAQDLGTAYDPVTGRMAKTDMGTVNAFSRGMGGDISSLIGAGFGNDVRNKMLNQERDQFNRGGMITGAIIGGGAGAAFGSSFGVPGAIIGLGIGASVGGLAGSGLARGIYANVEGMQKGLGMSTDPVIDPISAKYLQASKGSLAAMTGEGQGFNPLARKLYGANYADLNTNKKLVVDELIRRHGGEAGRAVMGKAPMEMDESQFMSIAHNEIGGAQVGNIFGFSDAPAGSETFASANVFARSKDSIEGRLLQEVAAEKGATLGDTYAGEPAWGDFVSQDMFLPIAGKKFEVDSGMAVGGAATTTGDPRAMAEHEAKRQLDMKVNLRRATKVVNGKLVVDRSAYKTVMEEMAANGTLPSGARQDVADVYAALDDDTANRLGFKVRGDGTAGGPLAGALSADFYSDGQMKDGFLTRGAGLAIGMGYAGLTAEGGGVTESSLQAAMKAAQDREYFNGDSKAASIGGLLDLYTDTKLGSGPHTADSRRAARAQYAQELRESGVLSDQSISLAMSDSGTGNLVTDRIGATGRKLGALGIEGSEALLKDAGSAEASGRASAYHQFRAARRKQYSSAIANYQLASQDKFAEFVAELSGGAGGDGVSPGSLQQSIDEANKTGGNVFELMQKGGGLGEMRRMVTALDAQLNKGGLDPAEKKRLEDVRKKLNHYATITDTADVDQFQSNMAASFFSVEGGKTTLSYEKAMEGFGALGLSTAPLSSSNFQNFQSVLTGGTAGSKDKTRKALLASMGVEDNADGRSRMAKAFGGRYAEKGGDEGFNMLVADAMNRNSGNADFNKGSAEFMLRQMRAGMDPAAKDQADSKRAKDQMYKDIKDMAAILREAAIMKPDMSLAVTFSEDGDKEKAGKEGQITVAQAAGGKP